jgi:hypothetical protein
VVLVTVALSPDGADASDAITDVDGESHDFVVRKIFPRLGEVDSTDAVIAHLQK